MGVTYDNTEKKFVFDFEHDGAEDIVSLTGDGYQVEAFGKCFYYGYEFSEQVESSVRTAFIKYVKFTEALRGTPDLSNFIKKAVDNLHKKINLYNFDLVVMPESSSKVNQYMLRYIGRLHYVRAGESMYSIAQSYGIRLKSLYKLNHMSPDDDIHIGQGLKLR